MVKVSQRPGGMSKSPGREENQGRRGNQLIVVVSRLEAISRRASRCDRRTHIAWRRAIYFIREVRFSTFDPQSPQLPSTILMTTTWVPWYDILLFFLRVGLTKIWELGTDPIAIRGSAVLEGPV